MSKIYFLNIKSKNVGPFTDVDIRDKIASGDLNENSYIFVKGTKAWVYLKQLSEFSDDLKVVEKSIIKRWYIHKDKENLGPYSVNDLIKLIKDGVYDLDDYTWSKGMSSWVPLRTLDELCVNIYDEAESSMKDIPRKDTSIKYDNENKDEEKTSISENSIKPKDSHYKSKLKENLNNNKESESKINDKESIKNKKSKTRDKKLLKKEKLEQKKLAKDIKAREKKEKEEKKKAKKEGKKTKEKQSRTLVKLVPELIFSVVLFFLGYNLENKQESMYLIILSVLLFLFFIHINFFRRKKEKSKKNKKK